MVSPKRLSAREQTATGKASQPIAPDKHEWQAYGRDMGYIPYKKSKGQSLAWQKAGELGQAPSTQEEDAVSGSPPPPAASMLAPRLSRQSPP